MPPIKQEAAFQCTKCGKLAVYAIDARPVCCGVPSHFRQVMFKGGDPDNTTIDLILIWPPAEIPGGHGNVWKGAAAFWTYTAPEINWHYSGEVPEAIWEVYQLRPGRYNGERIGWIGRRATGYEFRSVPGVRELSSRGFKLTREDCIEGLIDAINEG